MRRDPRKHVLPGQPLRLAAEQINALNKLMRVNAGAAAGPVGIPEPAKNIILCRNDSGSAVERWGILEISGVVFDPSSGSDAEATFTSTPCLSGVTPTDSLKPFVVAVEPIANGVIGRVAIAGVVQCKLDVQAESDKRAGTKTSSRDELKTGGDGPAEILWKQPGTGTGKWGLVRFGGGFGLRFGKVASTWNKGAYADVTWLSPDGSEKEGDPTPTFSALNQFATLPANTDETYVACALIDSTWMLVAWESDNIDDPEGCQAPNIAGHDLTTLPGYSAGKTQALGHESGCLKWLDIEDCPAEPPV